MIQGHEKLRIPDENKEHDFFIEVNWTRNKKIDGCKVLKMTFPDGSEAFVKKERLMAALFAIGTDDEQMKMVPEKHETVHWRKTILGVRAKNDIFKGQMINFPIEISFPCTNAAPVDKSPLTIH